MSLHELSAVEIARRVRSGETTARAVVESALARIAEVDSKVGAFLSVDADAARAAADRVDAIVAAGGDPGLLAGVPVAVKDNICTRGVATTCGSRMLQDYVPPYDATVVTQLVAAGAVVVGKTNLDEFAMGSSTENSALRRTANPWDLSKVPGGSSGGSAAAVAAGLVPISLGSDTGGSIRQPASFCGLVGVKPTYGRVSRYGLVAFGSSLDQIGPMARTAEDAALVLSTICGHDPRDSTSLPGDVPDFGVGLSDGIDGMRIGVPVEYFAAGISDPVRRSVDTAIETLRSLGAKVEETSLPHTEYSLPAYYIVAPAEASSNLARYDGVRYGHRTQRAGGHVDLFERTREEGFGAEVKSRILIGTYALSHGYYDAFYLKAMQVRTLIRQDFDRAFERFDALITPTTPSTAFGIGEKSDDPLAMKLADICTLSANLAGIPGLSVPCGFDESGLPVGMQLLGPALSENLLLRIAAAYQRATDWHCRTPAGVSS